MPPAKHALAANAPCPCGSKKTFASCCHTYISGQMPAPSAEALMRSRYSAHVTQAIDYLWETWDKNARSQSSKAEIAAWASSCEWQDLKIVATQGGQACDDQGLVSFVASFKQAGQAAQHREISLFKKQQGLWRYMGHASERH